MQVLTQSCESQRMHPIKTMRSKTVLLLGFLVGSLGLTQTFAQKPADVRLDEFKLLKAPKAHGLLLKQGDRLAICGDSITEQKMYSRLMEDYLTVGKPGYGRFLARPLGL